MEASKKKASVAPKQRKKAETKKQKNTRTTNKNVLVTHQKRKVDETKKDDDLLVRAKKRKAAASPNLLQKYDDLPIDNLAFLLRNVRKKKRSPYQSPNNPLLCVTPPVHPVIDPFLTPDINKFKRMDDWLRKRGERLVFISPFHLFRILKTCYSPNLFHLVYAESKSMAVLYFHHGLLF